MRLADGAVASFLLLQLGLILRCYAAEAKFFGWQMFSNATVYRTQLIGVGPDGQEAPLPPERWKPWITHRARRFVEPTDGPKIASRGHVFLLRVLARVPPFLCSKLGPRGYRRIVVVVEHRDAMEATAMVDTLTASCAP